jgi:hypothetical protein
LDAGTGGVVEDPIGLPGASLGSVIGIPEQGSGRVSGFEQREGIADAAKDDGQLVIEVVRGRSRDSARAVGFVQSFHDCILAGERGGNRDTSVEED